MGIEDKMLTSHPGKQNYVYDAAGYTAALWSFCIILRICSTQQTPDWSSTINDDF